MQERRTALRSVARLSFFIASCASARFSSLPLALSDVIGVEFPLVDGSGVPDGEVVMDTFPAFLAAFSASRFCFDADGILLTVLLLS